jgi:hypothetical protein
MDFALERRGFSVRLSAAVFDRRQWLIHGVLEYRFWEAEGSRIDVENEARRQLLHAISTVSSSALSSGARSVYVLVDGDDEVAGFYRLPGRSTHGRAAKA